MVMTFTEGSMYTHTHTHTHTNTHTQVLSNLGAADIDSRLEEQLIDGILFAFQEQTSEVRVHL